MANSPRDQDTDMAEDSSDDEFRLAIRSTAFPNGLPTPADGTPTEPSFTTSQQGQGRAMAGAQSSKGKNKRTAEDFEYALEREPETPTREAVPFASPVTPAGSVLPRILRRHHHRYLAPWFPGSPAGLMAPKVPFNIFKALLRHPNLFFQFAMRLPLDTFLDLYAIDKEFHYRLNKYSSSLIHDYADYHCPDAAYVFSWNLFPSLCISDPILKPMDNRPHLARDIPSFRWVKMVFFRNQIVEEILLKMARCGLRVPGEAKKVVMKYWVLMESKTQALREAFIQDKEVWSDQDILLFHHFLIKLDMLSAHPIRGQGVCELSRMVLMWSSLTLLHSVLHDEELQTYEDGEQLIGRTYPLEELDIIFSPDLEDEVESGIPLVEYGMMSYEGWDNRAKRMDSACDLLLAEGVKRGLYLNDKEMMAKWMLWGFVDGKSENLPLARHTRGTRGKRAREVWWPREEEHKKHIGLLDGLWVKDGGEDGMEI